jgi:tRNA (guanine-N7-)-methyltransferase
MDHRPPLRSFGRIKARTLKPRQAGLMETLLPRLALPQAGAIDVEAVFGRAAALPSPLEGSRWPEGPDEGTAAKGPVGRPSPVASRHRLPSRGEGPAASPLILEIGFGGGEHLVAQAMAHPEARFIGVEPFVNGVASCLRHIEEAFLPLDGGGVPSVSRQRYRRDGGGARAAVEEEASRGIAGTVSGPHPLSHRASRADSSPIEGERVNIRLHQGDARDVLARLPDASLDLVYILFPDPWPKTRHWKRRLIQRDFRDELARVLKSGAEVRFATDWANYAEWTLALFLRDARFAWLAERADDWRQPWPGHVPTRYEQKKLGDCAPVWLRFVRTRR